MASGCLLKSGHLLRGRRRIMGGCQGGNVGKRTCLGLFRSLRMIAKKRGFGLLESNSGFKPVFCLCLT